MDLTAVYFLTVNNIAIINFGPEVYLLKHCSEGAQLIYTLKCIVYIHRYKQYARANSLHYRFTTVMNKNN